MTALFVAIVIEQWKDSKVHAPAIIGFIMSVLFLFILGPDKFILPSLLITVIILIIIKGRLESGDEEEAQTISAEMEK